MKTTKETLLTGNFGMVVNKDKIVIESAEKDNIFVITEDFVAAGKSVCDHSLTLVAIGALTDHSEGTFNGQAVKRLADNAVLINNGEIEIFMGDFLEKYSDEIKQKKYDFISLYVMCAGKNSTLINNGKIAIHINNREDYQIPIYATCLKASENCHIINNGEISYDGVSTTTTHIRATMCRYENPYIENNGPISVNLEKAATVRILATIANGGSIANYGNIRINSSGRIMTIARLANTFLYNAGTVDINFKAKFIENKVAFMYQNYPMACALYEHCNPNTTALTPIVNDGKIKIHLDGSAESTAKAIAFGISSNMEAEETQLHRFENNGEIELSKSGPNDYLIAELGCNCQAKSNLPYPVEILNWKTKSRDFDKTYNLFAFGSANLDFSKTKIMVSGGKIDEKNLLIQAREQKDRGDEIAVFGTPVIEYI